MEIRLDENDYDIALLLQRSPMGLSFSEIVTLSGQSAQGAYGILERFRQANLVFLHRGPQARYSIMATNASLVIRRVQCPACGTIRRAHDRLIRVACINQQCRTRRGSQYQYTIISKRLLSRGIHERRHEAR